MRTDSVNLSSLALAAAEDNIKIYYGSEYVNIKNYKTKSKGAREAHEAIRPTYLDNQEIEGNSSEKRLYELIWKRTIASQMADARLEKTTVTIDISDRKEKFIAEGEVLKFDGFLKVYFESLDERAGGTRERTAAACGIRRELKYKSISAIEKYTYHLRGIRRQAW